MVSVVTHLSLISPKAKHDVNPKTKQTKVVTIYIYIYILNGNCSQRQETDSRQMIENLLGEQIGYLSFSSQLCFAFIFSVRFHRNSESPKSIEILILIGFRT